MLNLKIIGNKIAELRKQKRLTQLELANTLFVTHQAVSKWENGKSIPSIEILIELTSLFDTTIDYLLNNSEVKDNDFSTLFQQLPRQVVIGKYLNSDNVKNDFKNIFYLLNTEERMLIIKRIISETISIDILTIWPYLNDSERLYLLSIVLSNKFDYDLRYIYHLLSNKERMICSKRIEDGTYPYDLPVNIINRRYGVDYYEE